jgi:predicted double-glycine peptidase
MQRLVSRLLCVAGLGFFLVLSGCAGLRRDVALRVPDVQQTTDYTCGASALQAVLAYYGEETSESELAAELGTTPADGAPPEALVRVARAHGLSAELREDLRIADLAAAVRRGIPVIVAIQAWPSAPVLDYSQDWVDGHYVVVLSVERERVIVEDPSLLGSRGVLTHRELERRWHDEDGGIRRRHSGVLIWGRRPQPPPPYRAID